jgi:histidinol-phosphate/aromatic aminotransferase/cobyric acid decarboxylase-like protein
MAQTLRISIGTADENQHFIDALSSILETLPGVTA